MSTQGTISKRLLSTESAATVSNTTTATGPTACTIGANSLPDGGVICVKFGGQYDVTGTPTLTFSICNSTTAMLSLAAITATNDGDDVSFYGEFNGTVRSTGSSGTILWSGWVHTSDGLYTVGCDSTADTVDQSADITLAPKVAWSDASTSNALTFEFFTVEIP